MQKILLLTAGYGEGHNAAARGLHAAFQHLGSDPEIVDLFALTSGRIYEQSRRGYLGLINRAPRVWAGLYSVIDRLPVLSLTLPLLGKMRRTLARILEEKQPAAVVSVYPLYGYLLEQIHPRAKKRPFPFHTVVTDSITINRVWHRCASDTFLVPNEASARAMATAGVPREKLHVFGFPVTPQFADERASRPAPCAGNSPRVLYMINAGKDQAPEILRRLLQVDGVSFTVTVGRDEELRRRLEAISREAGRAVEILGWTERMPELIMSHHLLIGKAGGAAVQEAIAACTPMLITQVVPGQEEGNARLLLENGCGAFCPTADALAATIERVFADDAAEWRVWDKNICRLSRPDAAREIARFVLQGASAR